MVKPNDVTKLILDAAFAEGQGAAAAFYRYAPPGMTSEWIEEAQDRVVAVVSAPFEADPKYRSDALLMGIKTSACSGFERRWRELVNEDLGRPRR